jgi:hypothetical protein
MHRNYHKIDLETKYWLTNLRFLSGGGLGSIETHCSSDPSIFIPYTFDALAHRKFSNRSSHLITLIFLQVRSTKVWAWMKNKKFIGR